MSRFSTNELEFSRYLNQYNAITIIVHNSGLILVQFVNTQLYRFTLVIHY